MVLTPMRYVIVDLEGAARDYFDSLPSLHEELLEMHHEDAEQLKDLAVTTYDETGALVRVERAGDVLPLMETTQHLMGHVATGAESELELLQPA